MATNVIIKVINMGTFIMQSIHLCAVENVFA